MTRIEHASNLTYLVQPVVPIWFLSERRAQRKSLRLLKQASCVVSVGGTQEYFRSDAETCGKDSGKSTGVS